MNRQISPDLVRRYEKAFGFNDIPIGTAISNSRKEQLIELHIKLGMKPKWELLEKEYARH